MHFKFYKIHKIINTFTISMLVLIFSLIKFIKIIRLKMHRMILWKVHKVFDLIHNVMKPIVQNLQNHTGSSTIFLQFTKLSTKTTLKPLVLFFAKL